MATGWRQRWIRKALAITACCVAGVLGGCATRPAPTYTFTPEITQQLKSTGAGKVRFGEFRSVPSDIETKDLSTRGLNLSSPQGSFAAYLRYALLVEFREAGRWSDSAPAVVTGELLKNKLDAAIATGVGELTARITVTRGELVAYRKETTVRTSWESSFAAAVALPKAMNEYPELVRAFVGKLMADAEFLRAID